MEEASTTPEKPQHKHPGRRKILYNDKQWSSYGNEGVASYDRFFADQIGCQRIIPFLEDRAKETKELVVVDIGSPTTYLEEISHSVPLSYGLAISLSDLRSGGEKAYDQAHNIELIANDFLLPETRRQWEQKIGKQKINLAMIRLWGGWKNFPKRLEPTLDLKLRHLLLDQVYQHVDPNGGMILMDFEARFKPTISLWVAEMRKKGLDVKDYKGV